MSAPLRIGLLGASRIAESAITEASRETGDIRAAVAARDPERARAYAETHGYEGIRESYEELVADDSLDLIYIGLPNGLHAEWTARALEAGRSVLVEKPFAANLAEFDRVATRLESARGWAWEAFHYADHPAMHRLVELVRRGGVAEARGGSPCDPSRATLAGGIGATGGIGAAGGIGEIREIGVHMDMPAPPATDPRWSFDLAGGAMMDLGCYALNVLLLLGEAVGASLELISAEIEPYEGDARVDAAATVRLALGEAPVAMRTSMTSPDWNFGLRVVGSRGEVFLPNFVKPQEDDRLIVRTTTGAGVEEREERTGTLSSYVYQLHCVRNAVRGGERSAAGLARSRRTMALIDEVYTAGGLPLRPGRLG